MNAQARTNAPRQTATATNVASGILQRKCACGAHTIAGGDCQSCQKEKSNFNLQRSAFSAEGVNEVPPIVHEVLRSSGQPLDAHTRTFFESRFDHDFSRVRVHTDAKAAESARAVNARAYTVGPDVVFGAGQYAPSSGVFTCLFAHELTHVIQQEQTVENSRLRVVDNSEHEREADRIASVVLSKSAIPTPTQLSTRSVARQKIEPDELPKIERSFEIDPQLFLKPMDAPAPREVGKCEEFPGGSTDCEVDATGTPTGKVKQRVDETNPCTKPCVVEHEAVHVKQLKTFCPELRKCYLDADKGRRPVTDCVKMAIFGTKERECAAYKVSVPCMEKRLKTTKACQSEENKEYGTRKLASEKCFRDKACEGLGSK
jgi:Domain of unknown function (DUF4157)